MGLLLWFFHRFFVFQIRRVLCTQESHKEKLIRKTAAKIICLFTSQILDKNFFFHVPIARKTVPLGLKKSQE
ncbi:hypothetical protein HQ46_03630 [Porphyromonas gulae]|nr:hypothetical protein HQ46_03630 [Porphyromonas gulae]KKC51425.1 hypothetical protein HR10_03695 [Porphyromonas gulae]